MRASIGVSMYGGGRGENEATDWTQRELVKEGGWERTQSHNLIGSVGKNHLWSSLKGILRTHEDTCILTSDS